MSSGNARERQRPIVVACCRAASSSLEVGSHRNHLSCVSLEKQTWCRFLLHCYVTKWTMLWCQPR